MKAVLRHVWATIHTELHNGCHRASTAARPLVFDPCQSQLAKIIQLCLGPVFLQTPNCVKGTFLGGPAPSTVIGPARPPAPPKGVSGFVSSLNELCQSLRKFRNLITLGDLSLISQ